MLIGYRFITHNEKQTRWCLEHGADPNARNKNRYQNVPSLAGRFASASTCRLLASHGANFARSNALQRAAESRLKGRVDVLRWLIDEVGLPVNQREWEYDAAEFQNRRGSSLGAALHFAVLSGFPGHVQFLLERGCDINMPDTLGRTAWDWKPISGGEEVIAVLDNWKSNG